ncbi:MAG: hypothetical protein OEY96_03285 [Gammaproteobacteria bacterium]|nr:hypothetical protein [Gammaproteobacteria bacterium]
MKGLIFGFGFLAFLSFILGAGIVIGGIAAVELEKIGIEDMVWLTPLAFSFFLINVLIVYGFRKNKKWAFILAFVEMVAFTINGLLSLSSHGFSNIIGNLIIILLSVVALVLLKCEFENISRIQN